MNQFYGTTYTIKTYHKYEIIPRTVSIVQSSQDTIHNSCACVTHQFRVQLLIEDCLILHQSHSLGEPTGGDGLLEGMV